MGQRGHQQQMHHHHHGNDDGNDDGNEQNSALQSYQWLVENLITTITTLDRAMMDTFRMARVSSWELLHLQKTHHSMAKQLETLHTQQWLPAQLLQRELVFFGILWYSLVFFGILWYSLVFFRYSLVFFGILLYSLVFFLFSGAVFSIVVCPMILSH
jgi:hypothetical protein